MLFLRIFPTVFIGANALAFGAALYRYLFTPESKPFIPIANGFWCVCLITPIVKGLFGATPFLFARYLFTCGSVGGVVS